MRCQSQTVANATQLLNEVPLDSLDDTLTEIKAHVQKRYKIYTSSELWVIANEKLVRLEKRMQILVCDGDITTEKVNSILADLRSKQKRAIEHAAAITVKNGHFPLLPIISRAVLREALQMKLLRGANEERGAMFCSSEKMDDIVEIPSGCYWIVDVEIGEDLYRKSPGESVMLIMERQRLGQTTAEVVATALHSNVLSKHNLYALCSRVGSGVIPKLISVSTQDMKPLLMEIPIALGNTDSCAPACAYRMY